MQSVIRRMWAIQLRSAGCRQRGVTVGAAGSESRTHLYHRQRRQRRGNSVRLGPLPSTLSPQSASAHPSPVQTSAADSALRPGCELPPPLSLSLSLSLSLCLSVSLSVSLGRRSSCMLCTQRLSSSSVSAGGAPYTAPASKCRSSGEMSLWGPRGETSRARTHFRTGVSRARTCARTLSVASGPIAWSPLVNQGWESNFGNVTGYRLLSTLFKM